MTASKGLPKRLRHILALEDFEAAARGHLPRPIFGYVSGASETNASLRDNRLRSEEHTSELQSLMRISYAVFCLKKKKTTRTKKYSHQNNNWPQTHENSHTQQKKKRRKT